MSTRRLLALVALLLVSACAPKKTVPVPIVTTPTFPEFLAPVVPPPLANTPAAVNESRGWAFLQIGDLKTAEQEFQTALKTSPTFYPAEISLGYLELARKEPNEALTHFDRALEAHQDDPAALVGKGQASLALGRESDALAAFEAATAVDPYLVDIQRRVEVLKFRGLERELDRARQAARANRLDEAVRLYTAAIARSPESPFLYRELGAIERRQGRADAAFEHFQRAVALDPADTDSLVQIGDILEMRGDLDAAIKAYSDAMALETSAGVEAKLDAARARAELARLPAEYRAIGDALQLTRGDLAALVGVRLGGLLQPERRRDGLVITDLRTHWATPWIMTVANAGVMEPFANHTFQPRTVVRRTDLAQAVSRLLARIAQRRPAQAKAWESARLMFSDLAPGHLAYPAASMAVASGVMKMASDNSFQPSRVVTGAEAIDALDKLEAIADLPQAKTLR